VVATASSNLRSNLVCSHLPTLCRACCLLEPETKKLAWVTASVKQLDQEMLSLLCFFGLGIAVDHRCGSKIINILYKHDLCSLF
jgi:hypothetical protein